MTPLKRSVLCCEVYLSQTKVNPFWEKEMNAFQILQNVPVIFRTAVNLSCNTFDSDRVWCFLPFYRGSWNLSGFRTRKRIILIAIKQGDLINLFETLTLSWRWSLSYRKYSNDLQTSFFLAREYERFLRNNTFSFNKHNFIITATSLFIIQVKLEVTKILDSVFNVNQTFIQCITA